MPFKAFSAILDTFQRLFFEYTVKKVSVKAVLRRNINFRYEADIYVQFGNLFSSKNIIAADVQRSTFFHVWNYWDEPIRLLYFYYNICYAQSAEFPFKFCPQYLGNMSCFVEIQLHIHSGFQFCRWPSIISQHLCLEKLDIPFQDIVQPYTFDYFINGGQQ